MNLALPPIRVEEAVAAPCEVEEPATADPARPSHSMRIVTTSPTVEPATIDMTTTELPVPPKAISPLSVDGLRTAPGVNHFEGDVAILPRAPDKTMLQIVLPCLYDDRHFISFGEAKKYCFMKGTICYVYNDPTDPQPLYQISFSTPPTKSKYTVVVEDRWHPDPYSTTISPEPQTNLPRPEMKTVLLFKETATTTTTQLLYQFTFDTSQDATMADRFLSILQSIIST